MVLETVQSPSSSRPSSAPGRNCTSGTPVRSRMLYLLSYRGMSVVYGNRTRVSCLRGKRPRPARRTRHEQLVKLAKLGGVPPSHEPIVRAAGIAPATSVESGQRSAAELHAQTLLHSSLPRTVRAQRAFDAQPKELRRAGDENRTRLGLLGRQTHHQTATPASAPRVGLAPTTSRLTAARSTLELPGNEIVIEPAAGVAPTTSRVQTERSAS